MATRPSKGIPITRHDGAHRQDLLRMLRRLGRSRGIDRAFAVFVELSCLAVSNAVDKTLFDVREARYHEIRKGYRLLL